jgi:hypothetical protein
VADKVSKASVAYEHPAAKSNHCGICRHFQSPHACEIVAGEIQPEDWCERFAAADRGARRRYKGMT